MFCQILKPTYSDGASGFKLWTWILFQNKGFIGDLGLTMGLEGAEIKCRIKITVDAICNNDVSNKCP